MADRWYRVVAPHFVAGIAVRERRIVKTPPILAWARGRPLTVLTEKPQYRVEELAGGEESPDRA